MAALLRAGLIWLGFVVTVVSAYAAVREVRFGEVRAALASSNYWWLALIREDRSVYNLVQELTARVKQLR